MIEDWDNQYSGTKDDVTLSEVDMQDLMEGRSIYVRIGRWDDLTPAFIRVSPPNPSVPKPIGGQHE